MQMTGKGVFKVIKLVFKKEGIFGFYKGVPSVISTVGPINAVVFAAYE